MRKPLSIPLFAILGVLVCLGVMLVTDKLEVTPKFPAFAGEDDFALRIQYFLFIACPAFAVTGAWIGYVFNVNKRVGGYMWAGVLAGSLMTFSIAHLLSPRISGIASRDVANYGVLVLFLCWVLFSALGALVVRLAFRRTTG
jgi:hypothetical protein